MNYYGDYHVHTDFSDGKSSVDEIIESATAKGMKELAFTEHGLKNPSYSKKKLYAEYDYIQSIRDRSDISILFGNEADIVGENGKIDIDEYDAKLLDVLSVGFHQFAIPDSLRDWFRIFIPSVLNPFFSKNSVYRKRNTLTLIKCIENNRIDVLTHPNHRFFFDAKEVAKACADKGTYIELNEKHLDVVEELFDELLSTDVKMIVNSDSHDKRTVGVFDKADALIKKYGIEDRIVNLGKKPVFKNHR